MSSSTSSKFGPKFKVTPHVMGITPKRAIPYVFALGGFGAVAGFTALFFLEGIPRVQQDVFQKIPILGDYWTNRQLPASDNPF
ncbi:ubiquinol-cytochrome-c reductase complex subunit-domain-containing protein [Peziza echinospora]|nr:ubiquinol-cytochrome-c reductase complex subunit-domain-containing protein [Peziza echinospora]